MEIVVNGEAREVVRGTLAEVMEQLYGALPARGVAVAIDDEVVPRSQWSAREVCAGARLEVIRATQGG